MKASIGMGYDKFESGPAVRVSHAEPVGDHSITKSFEDSKHNSSSLKTSQLSNYQNDSQQEDQTEPQKMQKVDTDIESKKIV